jgi:hypothetical protein
MAKKGTPKRGPVVPAGFNRPKSITELMPTRSWLAQLHQWALLLTFAYQPAPAGSVLAIPSRPQDGEYSIPPFGETDGLRHLPCREADCGCLELFEKDEALPAREPVQPSFRLVLGRSGRIAP